MGIRTNCPGSSKDEKREALPVDESQTPISNSAWREENETGSDSSTIQVNEETKGELDVVLWTQIL